MTDRPAAERLGDPVDALELRGISHRYGTLVTLRDASLSVRPGTIHALVGENGAGKTTLMRIAYGMIRPEAGAIVIRGQARQFASPADAIEAGVGMVHQHFTLVPAMTVAENLALGGRGRYSREDAGRRTRELSDETGFRLDPDALAGTLPIAAQQRVEIAKALARRATTLVLDEPTGVLAPAEVDDLLRWLRAFVRRGHAVVLITHKLREALAVADDVTVLRRGTRVWRGQPADTSEIALGAAMIGGDTRPAAADAEPGVVANRADGAPIVFRAHRMDLRDAEGVVRVRGASFEIAAGELVGVVGVEGSGQRELLRALAGRMTIGGGMLDRPETVAFVPEDRHHDAVLLHRTLAENVALRGAGRARGRMNWRAVRARTHALLRTFDVRADGPDVRMSSLSGGNQQKLVLARELAPDAGEQCGETGGGGDDGRHPEGNARRESARGAPPEQQHTTVAAPHSHHSPASRGEQLPRALVLENPTRGLDIRAAAEMHARIRRAAAAGTAVVLYSSDLDEVLGLTSRVLVLYNGAVGEPVPTREATGRALLGLT